MVLFSSSSRALHRRFQIGRRSDGGVRCGGRRSVPSLAPARGELDAVFDAAFLRPQSSAVSPEPGTWRSRRALGNQQLNHVEILAIGPHREHQRRHAALFLHVDVRAGGESVSKKSVEPDVDAISSGVQFPSATFPLSLSEKPAWNRIHVRPLCEQHPAAPVAVLAVLIRGVNPRARRVDVETRIDEEPDGSVSLPQVAACSTVDLETVDDLRSAPGRRAEAGRLERPSLMAARNTAVRPRLETASTRAPRSTSIEPWRYP